ncbi:MAG: hypothetical protein HY735_26965 [Verrucomicrobia bacterium]|nr:hypothetical protein [Verrucomicrobiota bacterium]
MTGLAMLSHEDFVRDRGRGRIVRSDFFAGEIEPDEFVLAERRGGPVRFHMALQALGEFLMRHRSNWLVMQLDAILNRVTFQTIRALPFRAKAVRHRRRRTEERPAGRDASANDRFARRLAEITSGFDTGGLIGSLQGLLASLRIMSPSTGGARLLSSPDFFAGKDSRARQESRPTPRFLGSSGH